MSLKSLICTLLILSILPVSCTAAPVLQSAQSQPSTTLTVFAAASLTEAFSQLGTRFEADHPGAKAIFNFAGSQQLAQQIIQGAPVDVFASADQRQMEAVVQAGQVVQQSVQAFTGNRLVVIFPNGNPAKLKTLRDLAKPGLKLILAAKEVPVGHYSQQFLDKTAQDPALGAGFKTAVLRNVVSYEENVRAVLSKVLLGEADAGIVYSSDVSPDNASRLGELEIPDTLNVLATYYIAPVQSTTHAKLASAFVASALSPAGQEILKKYGFIPTR